jgi:hypothetical protein
VFLAPGSPWLHSSYPGLVALIAQRHELKLALIVYDIIPLRRPEWCDREHTETFRAWLHAMLPLCDHVFAISRCGARDVASYAREQMVPLRGPVQTIPIGRRLQLAPGGCHGPDGRASAARGRLRAVRLDHRGA